MFLAVGLEPGHVVLETLKGHRHRSLAVDDPGLSPLRHFPAGRGEELINGDRFRTRLEHDELLGGEHGSRRVLFGIAALDEDPDGDLSIDEAGVVYVPELQGRVSILNLDGEVLNQIGGERGHGPGEFYAPHCTWTDSEDSLYVGEVLEGQRIQKFVRK